MTFQKADIYTFLSVSAVRGGWGGGGEGGNEARGGWRKVAGGVERRGERRVVGVGWGEGGALFSFISFSILPPQL